MGRPDAAGHDNRSILERFTLLSILLPFVTLLLALAACGGNTGAEPAPPLIHYGEDICEFCGMIISDERYAAGYITEDGQQRIFDDVGGMFQTYLQRQETVRAFFVHDYEDTNWIRAETAYYVLSEDLPTPMLFGLAACATAEKAEALAAEGGGQVMTFAEVLAHYQESSSATAADGEQHREHTAHDQE